MPKSSSPKKPFRGNTFLLTSREYRKLDEKITDVLGQLRQTQVALLALMQAQQPTQAPEFSADIPAANEPVFETPADTAAIV